MAEAAGGLGRRTTWTHDPERKERILVAAAQVVARNGYHSASMTEIGASAGVTGPAVYRHFESKSAILVALFDQVVDGLIADARRVGQRAGGSPTAGGWATLRSLVRGQVDFVLTDRVVAQVYYTEIDSVPEGDRHRLRRKQRAYLQVWVDVLSTVRSELDAATARSIVQAAVGSIQSALFHTSRLPDDRLRPLLEQAALAVLASRPTT